MAAAGGRALKEAGGERTGCASTVAAATPEPSRRGAAQVGGGLPPSTGRRGAEHKQSTRE